MNEAQIPLSKLAAIQPIADALDLLGIDSEAVFSRYLISPHCDGNLDIPMRAFYDLMEGCAQEIKDQYFGSKLATSLADQATSFYGLNYTNDLSLAEVLIKFVIAQLEIYTSAPFQLVTVERRVSLIQIRDSVAPENTIQTDAWVTTCILAFTRKIVDPVWNPESVAITLFDPRTIPPDVLPSGSINRWDKSGCKLSLPMDWLLLRTGSEASFTDTDIAPLPTDLNKAILAVIRPLIGKNSLTLREVADYCGISPRNLQSSLASNNMTFNDLMASLKRDFAEEQLAEGSMKISTIAESLGYSDPSAFSRAFKNWTGLSPDQFRKQRGVLM